MSALCPRFHKAIELIGGRWTGALVRLLMGGRARFAELRDAIPEISDRMLSERLRILEVEGIITRHVLPDPPIRVEYELTQKGKELQKSLEAIGVWAERWIDAATIAPEPGRATKTARPARQTRATRPARTARQIRARG
jgi:DNA-binding HxlR family transcriptional regulator